MFKRILRSLVKDKKYWLLAFLVFLNFQPYIVWHIGAWGYLITIPTILALLFNSDNKAFGQPFFVFWVITVLFAAICGRNNILGIMMMLLSTCLLFTLRESALSNVYKKLHIIYAVTITISMVMWVLVVILSVSIPYHIVEPIVQIKDYNYTVYPFLVRTNLDSISFESLSSMYRFCGLYDEPGAVGTISFLFLSIERFKFSNKWNISILMSGLLSMSLFFYIATLLYFVVLLLFNHSVKINHKIAFLFFISLFVAFSFNNEVLRTLVWSRVEGQESARSLVDSRSSEELKQHVSRITDTSDYYFGVSDRKIVEKYSSSASIYNVIIEYGVITIILYSLFFVIYSFKFSLTRKDALLCLAVLALTLIQRPGLFVLYYLFLFRCLIILPRYSLKEPLNCKNSI